MKHLTMIRKRLALTHNASRQTLPTLAVIALCLSTYGGIKAPVQAHELAVSALGAQQLTANIKNPVFFVTDRKESVDGDEVRFVDGRSTTLAYGVSFTEPGTKDDIKTVVFNSADQFFSELAKYDKGQPICFLHGYHRDFKTSIELGFETAKGLDRPIVLFSWPTRNSYVKYFVDETNAEWAGPHFAAFLNDLGSHVQNKNITILSHSVGAKVMTSAFQSLAFDRSLKDFPKFGKVLMCSPDIDRDIFVDQAPLVKKMAQDVRIYVSKKDKRISVSNFVHGGYRVGSATKCKNIEGIEIVNFETEDKRRFGHSIPYVMLSRVLKGDIAASAARSSQPSFSTNP